MQNENEKDKKVKKASEMEDDEIEVYPDEEAMESYGEVSELEAPTVASCVSSVTLADSAAESESQVTTSTDQTDSYKTKWERAIRMKWMTVTGKQPLSIPLTMVYEQKSEKDRGPITAFFGDRRPLMVEQQRKEHWMKLKLKKEMARSYMNEGTVNCEVRLSDAFHGLRCLRFSPHAETMITSFGNGTVQVPALRYHPRIETKVYVGGASGTIQVFDTNNPKSIASVKEKHNEICNLDLSPDGSLLVSVGKDGNVYLYDAQKLRLLSLQSKPSIDEYTTPEKERSYHHMRLYGLKYHPRDPHVFVTGGWDYTVKVWDTRVCGAVNSISGPRICGDSIDVRGNEILTGSWSANNSLKLWDISSGSVLRHISVMNRSSPVDGEFIYVARFFTGARGTNSIVVGGNGTEDVQVINIDNNMAMASFPAMKAVTALDCHDDVVAYGGMESLLRIGDLHHTQTTPAENANA